MKKIIPLIPSFNPTNSLIQYVKDLYKSGFSEILIVESTVPF